MRFPLLTMPSFLTVFLTPFRAILYLLVRPKLLLWAAAPIILNLILFAALSTAGYQFVVRPLADYLQPNEGTWGKIVEAVVQFFFTLLLLSISALLAFILIVPVSAPFCDLISENIEHEMLADDPHLIAPSMPLWRGIVHSLRDAVRRVLVVIPIVIVLFLLGLIPIAGPLIASTLGLLYAGTFLAIDAFSYSHDRREIPLRKKWQFLRTHKTLWLPLGAGLSVLMLLPCNLFVVPLLSCVAGTQLYCAELLRQDRAKA